MSRLIELEDELTQILYKYNVVHRSLSGERAKIALDHKGLAEQTQKLTSLLEQHEKFLNEFNQNLKENIEFVLSRVETSMRSIAAEVSSEQIKAVVNPLEIAVDTAQSKINRLQWDDKALFWERLLITISSSVMSSLVIMFALLVIIQPKFITSDAQRDTYRIGAVYKKFYASLPPDEKKTMDQLLGENPSQ